MTILITKQQSEQVRLHPNIPKIIHQMWIGPPMPDYMKRCSETWLAHHPTWAYVLWGENQIYTTNPEKRWENWPLVDQAARISREPYQFISDVLRYEILNKHGGVWVDMDMECQKPIDNFCHFLPAWMGWEVPGRWANNAIIGATRNHPFLREAINLLPVSVEANRGLTNTKISGPQFITPIARRNGVQFLPKDFFYPYLWNELHRRDEAFPDSYAIHHWNNRRKRRGL